MFDYNFRWFLTLLRRGQECKPHTSEMITQNNFSSESKDYGFKTLWPHTLPVDKQ